MNKKLILESGDIFHGKGFGAKENISGEVIFHTGMTGYQEVISDPAYAGQIVCMTYPLIGNYGINRDDFESITPSIKGLIVKEICDFPSNFRSQMSIEEFFEQKKISGIYGIDTRRLTRILRDKGSLKGKIVDENADEQSVISELKNMNFSVKTSEISTKTPYVNPGRGMKVVMVDFGAKSSIIRELSQRNCDITVVPYDTSAEDILIMKPDGVLLSSGAGNPEELTQAQETVKNLLGKVPVFGINLGHLVLGISCGAKTYKLKTGNHGGAPVLDIASQKVRLTSQNQNYALEQESLKNTDLEETYLTVVGDINQGIRHKKLPCFSVQFHPEASPGAEDTNYIFDEFIKMMEEFKN
ncbi:MAG: carbamoyl phosphate synthase small subunit [Flavobacteriaceae bacterium]|nr:carbamoyl phosphate synthase small subunit [Flavobacteriaceae bacterium]